MEELLSELLTVVRNNPGLTGREYAKILRGDCFSNIGKSEVNHYLYGYPSYFEPNLDNNFKPAWTVKIEKSVSNTAKESSTTRTQVANQVTIQPEIVQDSSVSKIKTDSFEKVNDNFQWSKEFNLYDWQKRALSSWQTDSYRGIIQAVTGSGKTRVALAAMEAHLKKGWKVAIIVPVIELMNQWDVNIREQLNGKLGNNYRIGYLGNGYKQDLKYVDILLATSSSAQKYNMLPSGSKGFLIADECHHYGTKNSLLILEERFSRRLGLTASLERGDDGIDEVLMPYFHKISYELGYPEALEEKVIAPFKITFVGVHLSEDEKKEYDELETIIGKKLKILKDTYSNYLDNTKGSIWVKISKLARTDLDARVLESNIRSRSRMMYNTVSKMTAIPHFTDSIKKSKGTFGFTQETKPALLFSKIVSEFGIKNQVMIGEMENDHRRAILEKFKNRQLDQIIAPKLLDEGIDVPLADLAIITGMSRTKRQMIQRIGRVIRKKEDGGEGKIIIVYNRNTIEDPTKENGDNFYDAFFDDNVPIEKFDLPEEEKQLQNYLKSW